MAVAGAQLGRLPRPDSAGPLLLAGGVLAAGALIGAAAGVAPSLTLAAGGAIVFAAVVFRDLAAGTALYAFSIFAFQIPGLTGASGATPIKAIAALLVLSWLVQLLSTRGRAPLLLRDAPFAGWVAVALVLVAIASVVWAVVPGTALSGAGRLAQSVLPVFVVYTALREPKHVAWVIWAYVGGCAVATAAAVLIQGSSLAGTDETGRLATAVADPNFLAAALIPALLLALFGLAVVRSPLARAGLLLAAAFFLFALYLTQSRGGIVALLLCCALTPFLAGPLRARALAVLLSAGAVALVVFTLVAPPQDLGRFAQIGGGGTGRIDIWKVAKQSFQAHPILGVGQDNFVDVEQQYAIANVSLERFDLAASGHTVTHNLYLQLLTEIGLVGLALFAALASAALVAARRATRRFVGEPEELLARAVTIGLVGLLAAYVFLAAEYEKPLWLMLGIALALPRTAGGRLATSYDVQDAVVISQLEELEERIENRLEELLVEQRRLARRQSDIAQREQRVREQLRSLEAPATAAAGPQLTELAEAIESLRREVASAEPAAPAPELSELAAGLDALRREVAAMAVPAAPVPAPELGELAAAVEGLRREVASLSAQPAAPAPEFAELAAGLDALRREVAAMAVPAAPVPAPELGELGAAVDGLRRELASVTAQQTTHLERLRAEIAEARTAAEPPPSLPAPQVDRDTVARLAETERRLDEREAQLEERLAVVARRELELARRASELAARERTAASAQREPEPPPPAPVVAPAAPEPASAFDLERLERLVAENEARFPERAEEWRSYLFYLRDYVGADGRVPQRFEALVTDIFGDLGV